MRKRIRFSILNLLLAVTIVALGIALYQTRARLRSAESEVVRLRREAGFLSITDAKRTHAIAVPRAAGMTWRWRVYLPGGHDFGLYAYHGYLESINGYPADRRLSVTSRIGGQSDPHEPREVIIDVALSKSPEGDPCLRIADNGLHVGSVSFGPSLPDWAGGTMATSVMLSNRVAGRGEVVSAEVSQPLGLISLDGIRSGGKTSHDAVLIWIGEYQNNQKAMQSLVDDGMLP